MIDTHLRLVFAAARRSPPAGSSAASVTDRCMNNNAMTEVTKNILITNQIAVHIITGTLPTYLQKPAIHTICSK